MRVYELIQELARRGVELALAEGGQLKIWPVSKARDLMEEMRKHRHWLCERAAGRYEPTAENVREQVGRAGKIYCADLRELFPAEAIAEARRSRAVVEQLNGWYRLPTEAESLEHRRRTAQRRAA